mgnify:FL=1
MYIIWSKDNCINCNKAKSLLESKGFSYEERVIGKEYSREDLLECVPNAKSVPQIFYNNEYIGGFDSLLSKLNVS